MFINPLRIGLMTFLVFNCTVAFGGPISGGGPTEQVPDSPILIKQKRLRADTSGAEDEACYVYRDKVEVLSKGEKRTIPNVLDDETTVLEFIQDTKIGYVDIQPGNVQSQASEKYLVLTNEERFPRYPNYSVIKETGATEINNTSYAAVLLAAMMDSYCEVATRSFGQQW